MTAIYAVVRVGDADRFVLLTMVTLLDGFDPIRQLRLVTILVALMTYVVAVKVINLSNLRPHCGHLDFARLLKGRGCQTSDPAGLRTSAGTAKRREPFDAVALPCAA